MTQPLDQLHNTLDTLHANGKTARFWLRDDDAENPGAALDHLIALTFEHKVPCLLAVIPSGTDEALAAHLTNAGHVTIAPHGWSHRNHAPRTDKKRELGPDRPLANISAELFEGLTKLQALYGPRCLALLVPPWNRIDDTVISALPGIGYKGLSVFGPEKPGPLPILNTHVDLIDWKGTRGGRTDKALVKDLQTALALGIRDIGFLTHHLVHDSQAWDFLARFLALTAVHPACEWRCARNILHERVP